MTKKDITKALAERGHVSFAQALAVVQEVFDGIIDALIAEGRIELRGFGVFEVKKRKARKARNPRTGQAVLVPEKHTVSFKAGQEVLERVGKLKQVPGRDTSTGG
jgi:nucleoid DNA-binding protein